MALIGEDFRAARRGWLYGAKSGQHPLLAVGIAVLLFIVYSILQAVMAFICHILIYGGLPPLSVDLAERATLLKAGVVGLFPAALLSVAFAWWAAGWWNRTGDRGLALRLPKLGVLGWIIVIVAFIVIMNLVFGLAFTVLGIDPKTYAPGTGGLEGEGSMAGVVEKTIADLANEPMLFALALPGITFGAPIVEEFIFRGALFSAIRKSVLGSPGALVLTSAAWALVHGATAPWLFVGLLFVMGLILGFALLRFGSLWVTVLLHCVWNGLVSLSLFSIINTP